MIKINEIFYSIQGESTYVGNPTVFVRTTGCNLRCTYCDTKYSYYEGEFMTLEQIKEAIKPHHTKYVCITGGEPLLQIEVLTLIEDLCTDGYLVSVETSGSKSCKAVDSRAKLVIDIKTPDSGAKDSFNFENLELGNPSTEFKFVICSELDLEWAENFCRQHNLFTNYVILYSPSYGKIGERWLAEKILSKKSNACLQLQQHKYIWSPEQRSI